MGLRIFQSQFLHQNNSTVVQTYSIKSSLHIMLKKLELSGMQAVGSINSFHIPNCIHDIYYILLVEPADSNSRVFLNVFLQLDATKREVNGKPKFQSPLIRAYRWSTLLRVGLLRSCFYAIIVKSVYMLHLAIRLSIE